MRYSLPTRASTVLWASVLVTGLSAWSGCSVLFDASVQQCTTSDQCPAINGSALVCVSGLCVASTGASAPVGDAGAEPMLPFVVDSEYVTSGLMGDGENGHIAVSTACASRAGDARGLCHQFRYTAPASGGVGWGGVYWQFPANNWGTAPGYVLPDGARSVAFWAWADRDSLEVTFQAGIAAADGFEVSNMATLSTVPQRFLLSLEESTYAEVAGAFAWSTTTPTTAEHTIFIDDVIWTTETVPLDVSFAVDIDGPLAPGCFVGVFGSFNDWAVGQYRMDGPSVADVFTATIPLPRGEDFEYLFYQKCGDDETVEQMTSGSSCTVTSGSFTNRFVERLTPARRMLSPVCFESCDPCP